MNRHVLGLAAALLLAGCSELAGPVTGDRLLEAMAGTAPQTATVGAAVAVVPQVRVTDANGRALAGVEVAFATSAGTGSPGKTADTTDADGIASPDSWTMGLRTGSQSLVAFLPGTTNGTTVSFQATATAAAASTMTVTPAYAAIANGDSLQIAATFTDLFTNPAAPPGAVTYLSSDTTAIRVSATGRMRAVGTGFASVTVTSGALSRTIYAGVAGAATNAPHPSYTAHSGDVFAITAGNVAVLANPFGQSIARFDLATQTLLDTLQLGVQSNDVAVLPGGTVAWVAVDAATLHVVDLTTNAVVRIVPIPAIAFRIVASPDGAFVYAASGGSTYRVNTTTDAVTVIGTLGTIGGAAFNPAGSRLFLAATTGALHAMTLPGTVVTTSVFPTGTPQELAVSPDGNRIFLARQAGGLEMRRANDLGLITTSGAVTDAFSVAISPDGSRLVTVSLDGTVRVVDAATLTVLQSFSVPFARRVRFDASGDAWVTTSTSAEIVRIDF